MGTGGFSLGSLLDSIPCAITYLRPSPLKRRSSAPNCQNVPPANAVRYNRRILRALQWLLRGRPRPSLPIVGMTVQRLIAGTNLTDTVASGLAGAAKERCPHLAYRNVLGAETVAALLNYVTARERDFTPAAVRNRQSGQKRIDRAVRDCHCLADLGAFNVLIRTCLDRGAAQALQRLGLFESAVEPREFEISAYGDRGHFASHVDTFETLDKVRILSCVYYF